MYLHLVYTYSPIYKVHPLINTIRHFSQCSPTSKVRAQFSQCAWEQDVKTCLETNCQGCGGEQCQLCRADAGTDFSMAVLSERGNLGRLGRWDPASGNVGTMQISREPVGNLLGRFARLANCCSLASPRTRRKSTAAVRIIVIGTPWRHRKCALMPRLCAVWGEGVAKVIDESRQSQIHLLLTVLTCFNILGMFKTIGKEQNRGISYNHFQNSGAHSPWISVWDLENNSNHHLDSIWGGKKSTEKMTPKSTPRILTVYLL